MAVTISQDDAERMMGELESWWLDRVQNEISATVPKAIEYGANSMIEVGRSMLRIAGRTDVTDEEAIEVAVLFYVNGKIGRWIDAVAAGKRVSDDTIFDIGVYIKMAQRNRDVGSWPGVQPVKPHKIDGSTVRVSAEDLGLRPVPDHAPSGFQDYRLIRPDQMHDGRCESCGQTTYHSITCPTLIKTKKEN